MEDIPVFNKFPDVFPDELLGLPPDRQIEFEINHAPGTEAVSKAPYRMAPAEMKELVSQLQELLEKGVIRPSTSPWGASVLFVKKKDGSMSIKTTFIIHAFIGIHVDDESDYGLIAIVDDPELSSVPTEDPNMHIIDFIKICDTFKFNGVCEDAIKLRLFPFSLRDKAKCWLHSLPPGSITKWEDLAQKFLTKLFPMEKTAAIRNALTQFAQQSREFLCEA
ncbi:hypothetical protein AgCh_006138 [Apium graveolens]